LLWAGSEHRESPLLFTLRGIAPQITVHEMVPQHQPGTIKVSVSPFIFAPRPPKFGP